MDKIKKFLFLNTNTKQTVIKNTFWLFLSEFGMRFFKIILFVYATRKLGASEWGSFSYALALMGFFSILSDIGINGVLLREAAKKTEEQSKYIATGFFLKLILSVVSSLALLSTLLFLEDGDSIKILIPAAAFLLFIDSIREFGFSLNRAYEKMEIEAVTRIGTTILLIFLGFLFLKFRPNSFSLFSAYIIASIVGVLVMYFSLKEYFKNIYLNFKKDLLYPIWKEAWPIGIAGALSSIMLSIDIIILGWFESKEQIGIYSTAQKLTQVMYLLPILVSTALLPVLARFASFDLEKMRSTTNRMINFSFLFTIPVVLGCFLFASPVFDLLFGVEYAESVKIFKILSLGILTIAPANLVSSALLAEGKQNKLVKFVLISLLLNATLCLISIPYLGTEGAALSSTIAYTIGNIILIKKYIRLPSSKDYLKKI